MSEDGRPRRPRFRRLTLRARLGVLLAIAAAALIVSAVILFSSLSTLAEQRSLVIDDLDPAALAARDLRAAMIDQETGVRGYALNRQPEFLVPYNRGQTAALEAAAALEPTLTSDERTASDFRAVLDATERWNVEFAQRSLQLTDAGDQEAARSDELQEVGQQRFDEIRLAIDQLDEGITDRRDDAIVQLDVAAQRVWTVAVCALLGIVALGVVIAVALKRSVTDPILELAADVRTIAAGDLDRTVEVEATVELENLAADIDAMRLQILGEVDRLRRAQAEIEQQALDLKRSNADLEQFAYVASHDLQEPLRKIAGFCQLLERRYKGQLDERADEYIAFVVDGAKRMQDLINDLLAFSRVGRSTTTFAEVDLAAVTRDALDNLAATIDESGAKVVVGELPVIEGDRRLLVALMQNLIGNAVKFRGDEPPRVHVAAEPAVLAPGIGTHHDAVEGWTVSVADNGIGIEAEYAEQIFTIFQRLHNRTDYDGTGIGLALAKKIVEYHGGTIWLDTTVDVGATFRFQLPSVSDRVPVEVDGPSGGSATDTHLGGPANGSAADTHPDGRAGPGSAPVPRPQETAP